MHTHDEIEALTDRYLNDQLNGADKAAFEILMMEDPALLERVQLLDAFKQGLVAETAVLGGSASNNVVPFKAWLRQPMSLAASVLVAAMGLQIGYTGFVGQGAREGSLPIGSVVLLEGTRGNAAAEFVGQAPYLFQIDAGLGNSADAFAVTVRDNASNAVIVNQTGLRADADGWVRVVLNDELAGEYSVELTWPDGAGNTQARSFTIAVGN